LLKQSPGYQLLLGGATLYDEFEEHGINGCVQNKTMEIGSGILKI